MRDILVTLLVFGSLPLILWRPYTGILVWSWISYMNPHRQTWGFAYDMPFAQIVAITLFVAMLFSKERYRLPVSGLLVLWFFFLVWMSITTLTAIYPERAMSLYTTVIKIQVITWLTLVLMNSQERIRQLIWVIIGSIGFYCIKGGVFTLLTGGAFRVYGPSGSNIQENNALALATLMVIPLMVYLYQCNPQKKAVRFFLGASIFFSLVSAVGSQSRGALLAIIAVGGFYWLKTNSKILSGTAIAFLAVLVFNFMPQSWHDRMSTISNYEEDESAMARIHAWVYSVNIANDRLVGGGFNSWSKRTYAIYSPEGTEAFVAHSIYFAVLADHGWVGLAMFLGVLFLTWRRLARLAKMGDPPNDDFRPATLAKMLQVSLVAYMAGGAFLSLSYFDLPWHLIAIAVLVSELYKAESAGSSLPTAPSTPMSARIHG